MDHHIPEAISSSLRRRGIDILTAMDDSHSRASDEVILKRATELGRVVYTHEQDYLVLASRWLQENRAFPGIIFSQQEKVSIGKTIEDLELIARLLEGQEMANRIQFLPL
jgi:predicted nuclease of predicted toxin-antitoxin system